MRRPAPSRGKRPQQGPTRLSTLPSCRHSFPLPLCSPPDEWTARANWRYGISAMRCTNEHEPLRLSSTFRLLALFAPSGNQKRGRQRRRGSVRNRGHVSRPPENHVSRKVRTSKEDGLSVLLTNLTESACRRNTRFGHYPSPKNDLGFPDRTLSDLPEEPEEPEDPGPRLVHKRPERFLQITSTE